MASDSAQYAEYSEGYDLVVTPQQDSGAFLVRCLSSNEYHADFSGIYVELSETLRDEVCALKVLLKLGSFLTDNLNFMSAHNSNFYAIEETRSICIEAINIDDSDDSFDSLDDFVEVASLARGDLERVSGSSECGQIHVCKTGFHFVFYAKHGDIRYVSSPLPFDIIDSGQFASIWRMVKILIKKTFWNAWRFVKCR